ncbi:hypothetical protein [Capnocytophaga catalasegens]|uniref:Cyclic nucleotide-binding domain-containing protein n=1 Tax=Capnocytophaga catalasegens TaxID=1004260 RepID=A0AAV5AWH3_9FLAO|nr:hypothetical protein [Capnocytophaga catalasegens]GIZ15085.1 hypothetical protein RCZ03_10850 [Capnocytophaga catalasegens]GJM50030.1 hypothetical protein RCZ15_10050 [Capnocytophaga catalasegens]GJM53901.1 hypothetical protein RCZ16_22170 [Capnocytophaga catalasegens]
MLNSFDFSKIYTHPLISENNLAKIVQAHHRIEFKKGDFILRKNEIARGYLILESGIVRSYVVDYE